MEKTKKIVLFSNSSSLLSFRDKLILELVNKKHDVILIFPTNEKKFNEFSNFKNLTIYDLNFQSRTTNPFSELVLIAKIFKFMLKIRPNFVFTFTVKPNLYMGIIRYFINFDLIITITGIGNSRKNFYSIIVDSLYRIVLPKTKHIFFQNTNNRDFFLTNFKLHNNFSVVPGSGINIERFPIKDKPFLINIPMKILYFGRLEIEKGIYSFLKVAERVKSKNNLFEFYIYGDSSNNKILLDVINNPFVIYNGVSINSNQTYNFYDCLVNPSFSEGTSNVVLESISKGLIVFGANIPGISNIIINEYFLFNPHHIEEIIEKIFLLLNPVINHSELKNLLALQLKYVQKNFDRNIVVESYTRIINE